MLELFRKKNQSTVLTMSTCDQQKKAAERADNRAQFPNAAAVVDMFRAVFGPGVKLLYAEEDGRTIGKKPPAPVKFIWAEDWLKFSAQLAGNTSMLARFSARKKKRGKDEH